MVKFFEEKKRIETSGIQKLVSSLIAILIFPIILISSITIATNFYTKNNSDIPTLFSISVITINEKIENFEAGQKVLIKSIAPEEIKRHNFIAYFVPVDEGSVTDKGSPVGFGKVIFISQSEEYGFLFGVSTEEFYVIQDAVIGVYVENGSAVLTELISWFSSNAALVLCAYLPLGILLILLVVDFIEQNSIRKMNKQLDDIIIQIRNKFEDELKNSSQEEKDLKKEALEKFIEENLNSQKVQTGRPFRPLPPRPPLQQKNVEQADAGRPPLSPRPIVPPRPAPPQRPAMPPKMVLKTTSEKPNLPPRPNLPPKPQPEEKPQQKIVVPPRPKPPLPPKKENRPPLPPRPN